MDSVLTWLLISVLLLAAFGGVAFILPSKLQRSVAKTRQSARQFGFSISSEVLLDLDAAPEDKVTSGGKVINKTRICVIYELPFENPLATEIRWQLVRYKKSDVPLNGWMLKDSVHEGVDLIDSEYWVLINDLIQHIPPKCWSLKVDKHSVAWIGSEANDLVMSEKFLPELKHKLTDFQTICLAKSRQTVSQELE